MNKFLHINPEVRDALQAKAPVVALETTIISHGMPFPANVETALAVEDVVRKNGAVPATIGILDGTIVVGLTPKQVESFGQAHNVAKVSRRDLPVIVASKRNGATTVAATMICASMAGIRLFVTGGIGGVHREGEVTMDVSADLLELANTSVAVVCAGAKAILDIGRSLEVLETHGVPVLGFGTDEFPAFYTRTSGFGVDCRFDREAEIAEVLRVKWELGLTGGAVIAVPVPQSEALEESVMNDAIRRALLDAKESGISGKNVTPFLLSRVSELTGGNSLRTNIALIKNNAAVGSRIAVAMAGSR